MKHHSDKAASRNLLLSAVALRPSGYRVYVVGQLPTSAIRTCCFVQAVVADSCSQRITSPESYLGCRRRWPDIGGHAAQDVGRRMTSTVWRASTVVLYRYNALGWPSSCLLSASAPTLRPDDMPAWRRRVCRDFSCWLQVVEAVAARAVIAGPIEERVRGGGFIIVWVGGQDGGGVHRGMRSLASSL